MRARRAVQDIRPGAYCAQFDKTSWEIRFAFFSNRIGITNRYHVLGAGITPVLAWLDAKRNLGLCRQK